MESGFRWLDHTADWSFEVWAGSFAELLAVAVQALVETVFEGSTVLPIHSREFDLAGEDEEELLAALLREVLYLMEVEGFVAARAVCSFEPPGLRCTLVGEEVDPERHRVVREVKAVTYHGLEVTRTEQGLEARVVLDL